MAGKSQKPDHVVFYAGLEENLFTSRKYPVWRYHKILPPIIVNNTDEDLQAIEKGYEGNFEHVTANKQLINWYWDLEDMSKKQLIVFAKDEFDVDLPEGTSQTKLMEIVCKLSKASPKNEGRMVLMAHTIQMNYEETISEIKREMEKEESKTERFEVFL